jgi:hypothetical protein
METESHLGRVVMHLPQLTRGLAKRDSALGSFLTAEKGRPNCEKVQ